MKHVDVLHSCAIMTATVQTAERQGRHWYHISTPKLTIHVLMQESIHCSSTGIFLSSPAKHQSWISCIQGQDHWKGQGLCWVVNPVSQGNREKQGVTLATCALAFICDEIPTVGSYYGEWGTTEMRQALTQPTDIWATHKNYVKNMKYIWKMFPKATFTSRFDLAHCLSQLKIRPWKMPIVRLLICVQLVEQRKAVSLPGIYKT